VNILLTNFHRQGHGQVEYVLLLARALRDRGDAVTIGGRGGSRLAQRAREMGLPVEDGFDFSPGLHPRRLRRDIRLVRRLVRERGLELIHVNGSQDHWAVALANRRLKPRLAVVRTKHNTYPAKNHFANRFLYRRATDQIIVVSEAVRDQMLENRLFRGCAITPIHNALDAGRYDPSTPSRGLKAALGFPPDALVVGVVGRITPAKGHRYLFEGLQEDLRRADADLRLLILGVGEERNAMQELCRRLGIRRHVYFAGFRDDVQRYMNVFDIGVMPSVDCESSSFALKEQMAMARPMVCTDFSGNGEIVAEGETGYLVPVADPGALAEKIRRLKDSPETRRQFGQAGRTRIETAFSLEAFVERTLAVYRQALERTGQ